MEFIKDCLNRNYSLKFVSTKWRINEEDILEEFLKQKKRFTKEEIEQVMKEVYYIWEIRNQYGNMIFSQTSY